MIVTCKIKNEKIDDKYAIKLEGKYYVSKDIMDFAWEELKKSYITLEEVQHLMDLMLEWKYYLNKLSRYIRKKSKIDNLEVDHILRDIYLFEKDYFEGNYAKDRKLATREEHLSFVKGILDTPYFDKIEKVSLTTYSEKDLTDEEYRVVTRYLKDRYYYENKYIY